MCASIEVLDIFRITSKNEMKKHNKGPVPPIDACCACVCAHVRVGVCVHMQVQVRVRVCVCVRGRGCGCDHES